jgi:class 3 adenylate cyclase/YHS domain-containing protein
VLEALGVEEPRGTRGRMTRAVLFVDLSSFTPLTHAMGDVTAAGILARFATHVRQTTRRHGGNVVKQIGDGFMLVFSDAASAVSAAIALNRRLCQEPQFPAMHAGAHFGSVLYREGDYLGSTVNVAARLLNEAGPHEIVVTAELRREVGSLTSPTLQPLGVRDIKGLSSPLELYRVEDEVQSTTRRRTDPVCGMQLHDDELAARMSLGDEEYVFCSTRCLGLFAARTTAGD